MSKPNLDHPIILGDTVAQEIYKKPTEAWPRLEELGGQALAFYHRSTTVQRDPELAARLTSRDVWRASIAPILHGIGIEHDKLVKALQQDGSLLTPPSTADLSGVNRIIRQYGNYEGKSLAFLQASGRLAQIASGKFLKQVVKDEHRHWCTPLLDAYKRFHYRAQGAPRPRDFVTRDTVPEYIRDIYIAAGTTVLQALVPAGTHAQLWPGAKDGTASAVQSRIDELGWTQFISANLYERYFSGQRADESPPAKCPFAHDAAAIATSTIWDLPALQNGPLYPERYCPADVVLTSPYERGYRNVSAATLRLVNDIPIAAATIWA